MCTCKKEIRFKKKNPKKIKLKLTAKDPPVKGVVGKKKPTGFMKEKF